MTGTFTISNSGSADLNLTGIPAVTLMTGPGVAHFSLTQPPTSLVGPGNTTPFEVQFAPTTTGLHTATVSIANNDSDENPYTFVIQGESVYGIYLPLIFKN